MIHLENSKVSAAFELSGGGSLVKAAVVEKQCKSFCRATGLRKQKFSKSVHKLS